MLIAIARNTVRQSIRSGVLPVACIVVTLLLGLAAFAAHRHQRMLNAERARYNEAVRTQWLEQPDRHPHRVSHYGYLAFRVKSPLSFFDGGVDSYAGTAVFLEAHRQNPANFSEAGQSPVLARLGELTPALVLQLLVPLVVFFLGYAAISGERENGTLALTLAQGVPPRVLLAGKTLGLLAATALLLLPGLLLVLVLAGVSDPALLPRAAVLAGAHGIYAGICALLAVGVSAASRTSRSALTTLIMLWVFGWVAMPRALQAWGAAMAPAPSRSQFDAALEAALEREGDSHNAADPHFAALRARTLAEYKVAKIEDLPFNYSALVMKEGEAIGSAIFGRRYGDLIATFRRQGEPLERGSLLNPYLAVRRISMALAGSDMRHFIGFQRQAEAFRFAMIQKLNDLHLHEVRSGDDGDQRLSKDRWRSFPVFEYRPPGLSDVLREHGAALGSLALWIALLSAALAFRTLR